MKSHISTTFRTADWRNEILRNPRTPIVVAHVKASKTQAIEEIRNANLSEVAGFTNLVRAGADKEWARVNALFTLHTETFISVVENDFDISYPDYSFVVEHGILRARQNYPLAIQLHSYRIGQRVRWENLCQPLVENGGPMPEPAWRLMVLLSVFTFEYVNHISAILADAYYKETTNLERTASNVRTEFIERLLSKPDDPTLAKTAQRFNLDAHSPYLVVVASELDSAEANSEEMSGMQRLFDKILAKICENRLIEFWHGDVICILSAREISDYEVENVLVQGLANGSALPGIRIGISARQPGLTSIAEGYEDAHTALRQTFSEGQIRRFNAISAFDHLLENARHSSYRFNPSWAESLIEEDQRTGGALLKTLNTYVNCRMSAKKAGEALGVHTNTVYQRINKIEELCSSDKSERPNLIDILVVANLHRHNAK